MHDDDSDSEDEEISLASQHHATNNSNGDYFPDANKHKAIEPSPLHQEVHLSDDESLDEFPELSRRSSRISWAATHSYHDHPSPSKDGSDRRGSKDAQPRPPGLRVTSASDLPTESSPLIDFDNTTPLRPPMDRVTSQNAGNLNAQSEGALAPLPATPSRQSLSRTILPGPYISPLSGGLSAVVADSLRRGTDVYGSRRRPRLTLSRTVSNAMDGSEDEESPSLSRIRSRPITRPGSPPKRRKRNGERDNAQMSLSRSLENDTLLGGRPRAKSLGGRLSSFFTFQRTGNAINADEESGGGSNERLGGDGSNERPSGGGRTVSSVSRVLNDAGV